MERIEFKYMRSDDFNHSAESENVSVSTMDKDEVGLNVMDVCELFERFMGMVGFSEDKVREYFFK